MAGNVNLYRRPPARQDGVAQGMKPDITIGMRGQAAVMLDFHTAKNYRPVTITKTVNVESVSRPYVDWRAVSWHVEFSVAGDKGGKDGEITWRRQFHQEIITLHDGDKRLIFLIKTNVIRNLAVRRVAAMACQSLRDGTSAGSAHVQGRHGQLSQ